MPFDWREIHTSAHPTPTVVDPQRRLRICLPVFLALLAIIFLRAMQLEFSQGEGFRAEAARPIERKTAIPAPRGRILARDGTVLACDTISPAVAVHYRWLQNPADERWLLATARSRLSKIDRKNPQKLSEACESIRKERARLAEELAGQCGLSPDQWTDRARRIQTRVEQISRSANRHEKEENEAERSADTSPAARIRRLLLEDPPPPKITVAEELDYHIMAENVSSDVMAEIEKNLDRYPGVKIVEQSRRFYPNGSMAAHVIGHMGPVDPKQLKAESNDRDSYEPKDLTGRTGVEWQYESVLRGRRGEAVEQTDRSGRLMSHYERQKAVAGRDLALTLYPALQQTAESLLEHSRNRLAGQDEPPATQETVPNRELHGGAIAVMDVEDGSLWTVASSPRFDPNAFVDSDRTKAAAFLGDPSHPMLDRVCRMAIPPGSTFKVVTALALLKTSTTRAEESFECQGFLSRPDQQRCEIFVRQGVGHGEVTLSDALAVSCNVYFFHYAGLMGPRPLVDWASRLGMGRPTGIDLPGETAGMLPCPENIRLLEGHTWRVADTQSMAVGQGSLTVTPLQMLCMMAALANGGRLVTPHVAQASSQSSFPPPQPVPGLQGSSLDVIRDGLRRVVSDPKGTAHDTIYLDSVAVAGKTGTAETGNDQASHAWFAGYAPADSPKAAFVVVLEHGGDAATAVGPIVKQLVLRMQQLGMLQ